MFKVAFAVRFTLFELTHLLAASPTRCSSTHTSLHSYWALRAIIIIYYISVVYGLILCTFYIKWLAYVRLVNLISVNRYFVNLYDITQFPALLTQHYTYMCVNLRNESDQIDRNLEHVYHFSVMVTWLLIEPFKLSCPLLTSPTYCRWGYLRDVQAVRYNHHCTFVAQCERLIQFNGISYVLVSRTFFHMLVVTLSQSLIPYICYYCNRFKRVWSDFRVLWLYDLEILQ